VYTSSVLRGAPYAFIKFHLLIKKKKKHFFKLKTKNTYPNILTAQNSAFFFFHF